MMDPSTSRPCRACAGRGYFPSTIRRYKPLCHVCRGTGIVSVAAVANRSSYIFHYERDVRVADRMLWEAIANAASESRASTLSTS